MSLQKTIIDIPRQDQHLVDSMKEFFKKNDVGCEYDVEKAGVGNVSNSIPFVFYIDTPKGTAYYRLFVTKKAIEDVKYLKDYLLTRIKDEVKILLQRKEQEQECDCGQCNDVWFDNESVRRCDHCDGIVSEPEQ